MHARRGRVVARPSGGSYHRTAALDGRRASRPPERLPSATDRGRSYPAPGDRRHDVRAERTGEVGDPAGGAAGGRGDDGPRVGRDARSHGADAPCAGRAGRADGRSGRSAAWTIEGGVAVQAMDERVPGDVSAAAFWLVAGAIHPDAELRLRGVGVNPTRRAVIDILRAMGADIEEEATTTGAATTASASPWPTWSSARHAPRDRARAGRRGTAIDEIPILCLAATQATGTTVIRGAGELRHKESDRIAGIAAGLRALGARIEVDGDDIRIEGGATLHGAETDSLDDHRLAMTFAIAGLVASDTTTIGRPGSPPSPIPASSTTSKGCEHDQARRPHRPPRRPFAVRRDAAGRVRFARHRRELRAVGQDLDRARRRGRRAPRRRLPRRQRHDPAQGAGRADGRPPDRGRPSHRRGQHDHPRGQAADRPQHGRARLQGRARQARRQAEDAAPGRRPRSGRRRAGGRLRPDHRGLPADHRVQSPPPSGRGAGQALRPERGAHGAAGDALARVDHRVRAGQDAGPGQRDLDRPDRRREPDPGRGAPRRPARARPDLRADAAPARRRGGRRDGRRRRADAAPPGRGGVHAVDRPAGAARADAGQARRGPRRRAASAEGEPTGAAVTDVPAATAAD